MALAQCWEIWPRSENTGRLSLQQQTSLSTIGFQFLTADHHQNMSCSLFMLPRGLWYTLLSVRL